MALQTPDRLTSTCNSGEALNKLILETTLRDADVDPKPLNNQNAATVLPWKEDGDHLGAFILDFETACLSNAFTHQPHSTYFGGYQSGAGKQVMYPNSLEDGCYSMYNEPHAFHGYEYNHQRHHKSYAPYTSQLFSRSHGHCNAQQFPSSNVYYNHLQTSQTTPYNASPTPAARSKFPVDVDLLGDGRHRRTVPLGSGRGFSVCGKSEKFGFSHKGFEDFEFGGIWSGWSKPLNGKSSLLQFPPEAASLKPFEMHGNHLQKDSQQKETFYGSRSFSEGVMNSRATVLFLLIP